MTGPTPVESRAGASLAGRAKRRAPTLFAQVDPVFVDLLDGGSASAGRGGPATGRAGSAIAERAGSTDDRGAAAERVASPTGAGAGATTVDGGAGGSARGSSHQRISIVSTTAFSASATKRRPSERVHGGLGARIAGVSSRWITGIRRSRC